MFFIYFLLISIHVSICSQGIPIEVLQINDDFRCSQCDHRSICIRLSNSSEIHCICLPGFVYSSTVDRCVLKKIPIDGICDDRYECFNGGFCSNETNRCQCQQGFTGLMCELDINECFLDENICGSNLCFNLPGDYRCLCDLFHSGKHCERISSIIISIVLFSSMIILLLIISLILFISSPKFLNSIKTKNSKENNFDEKYLARLTTSGLIGNDRFQRNSSIIRSISHEIYLPIPRRMHHSVDQQSLSIQQTNSSNLNPLSLARKFSKLNRWTIDVDNIER